MLKPAFLLSLLFAAQLATSQQQPRYRITQKGKTGYINCSGTTVIQPIYHNGFEFAEGLAAVREKDLYGFIDTTGKYVITPQFDYATYFVNGITLVYKNRQSYFIDKTGRMLFPPVYKSMQFINDHKAIVTTKTNKTGIIDIRTGRLLLDTLYDNIGAFNNGVAVVRKHEVAADSSWQVHMAVIDVACNFIVPFDKFEYIKDFHDGYASVTVDFNNGVHGVIDTTGRLLKKKTPTNSWNITGDFHDGISKFSHDYGPNSYDGYINLTGDTILDDAAYKWINDFSCGRGVISDQNDQYFVLDRNGKKVNSQPFQYIQEKFFRNYAIAKTSTGYGIIDTNARFVIQPQYAQLSFPDTSVDLFFFGVPDGKKEFSYKFGLADMNNQIIIQPVMDYAERGFVNGILKTTVNGIDTWLNKQGHIVWQESIEDEKTTRSLNIDYMGFSTYRDYPGHSANGYIVMDAKKITAANHFARNEFIFKIDTSLTDTTFNRYFVYKLIVGNSTKDTIKLLSISGLAMRLEALDEDGAWKAIELITFPTHTNGYSITLLKPGTYWPFIIPRYEGAFKTKLRAALWYLDKNGQKQIIYSNAINASINKNQFWREYDCPEGVSDSPRYNRGVNMSTIKEDNYGNFVY